MTPNAPAPVRPPRRRGRTAGIVIALAVVVAACGGGDDTATSATTAQTAPPTTTTTSTTTAPTTAADAVVPTGWAPVEAGAMTPPPRSGAVLAASPDGTVWLHGGHVDGDPLGDLWRFDGAAWQEVTPTGSAPSPRSEHLAVWDDERDRMVIALGQAVGSEVFDDVWAFDPATGAWSQLATGGPAARYGACGVLDDQGRLVITHGFSTSVRFDDTWAFDLAADAWADITPADGPRPSARCLQACAYDPATGVMTLFGGRNDDTPYLGDTWQLGDAGWQELAGPGPSPRARSRGLFRDGVQVLGGAGPDGLVGDAWTLVDGVWQPGPAEAPADRQAPAVAQGPDGTVWLFGGLGEGDAPLADLWTFG